MSNETFEGTIKFVDPTGWSLIIPFAEVEAQVFFHATKVVGCEFASLRRKDKVVFQLAKRIRQGRKTAASVEVLTRRSHLEYEKRNEPTFMRGMRDDYVPEAKQGQWVANVSHLPRGRRDRDSAGAPEQI